ncbi:MAG: formylmethanofuran dehydrogenase subunit E family protein [Methanocalculaceae archaeon]|jgi:formylmethanofuran dehydrogenase subunit E|nr:formylmethanofuran dehydrogenase subunit E family protein [Methanocalculaceae archaeon]
MVQIPSFETIAQSHGHTCPGIVLGYKIAVTAARWVGDCDDVRITAHTTRCPLDALQVTFDVKNHPERMTVEDTGTVSFVITKPDGSRLFIDELPGTHLTSDELTELKKKAAANTATPADLKCMNEIKDELFKVMQAIPNEKLFVVREE